MDQRVKEYIGDAVYELIVRTELAKTDLSNGRFPIMTKLTSNKFMNHAGKEIGLSLREKSPSSVKGYADALESVFCELYYEGGLDLARKYFRRNIVPIWNAQTEFYKIN